MTPNGRSAEGIFEPSQSPACGGRTRRDGGEVEPCSIADRPSRARSRSRRGARIRRSTLPAEQRRRGVDREAPAARANTHGHAARTVGQATGGRARTPRERGGRRRGGDSAVASEHGKPGDGDDGEADGRHERAGHAHRGGALGQQAAPQHSVTSASGTMVMFMCLCSAQFSVLCRWRSPRCAAARACWPSAPPVRACRVCCCRPSGSRRSSSWRGDLRGLRRDRRARGPRRGARRARGVRARPPVGRPTPARRPGRGRSASPRGRSRSTPRRRC